MKNAIDHLHAEWAHKPIGFVSYGGVSAGTRAVQQLKARASDESNNAFPAALKSGGGSAVYTSGVLQRIWRDVQTMRGHVWFDVDDVVQQHARQVLGLPPDPQVGLWETGRLPRRPWSSPSVASTPAR